MHSLCGTCAPRGEHCSGNCTATLKRILANDEKAHAGGPRTPQGKAVSARNATSHGLFARDIVLPALGEDPEGYRQIEAEFTAQIAPRNLLERHYVEKIAAASWRLRRLHRWQAQLFEDEMLTEDERLDKLDKVLRHENHLHRQIDTAVKMLNKDVPQLAQSRARDQALRTTMQTELDCRENRENELEVTFEAREWLKQMTAAPPLDDCRLDATPPTDSGEIFAVENRQTAESTSVPPLRRAGEGLGVSSGPGPKNCQNEPVPPSPFPNREGSALAPGVGNALGCDSKKPPASRRGAKEAAN